jgi:hypothetical protein
LVIETNPSDPNPGEHNEDQRRAPSSPITGPPRTGISRSNSQAQRSSPAPHSGVIRRDRRTTPSSSRLESVPLATSDSPRQQPTPASRSSPLPPSSRQTSESNEDSSPSHKRSQLVPAPFRQGYSPGPKPKAADYGEGVEKMLLNAMHEYACLILTVDAFPDEVKQTQWARATWLATCEDAGEQYECSSRMIRLVRPLFCRAKGSS